MPARMDRRTLLRAAGIGLALPLLDAMRASLRADPTQPGAGIEGPPRRMVGIQTNMGILPQFFFPETAGAEYQATPYLERLKDYRGRFTVFSGVSHPDVTGGHAAEKCFLTGTPRPERGGFRNWISLDQFAAEQLGNRTRYPSLTLAVSGENHATLSYTRSGAPIPAERSPRKLFQKLFLQGDPAEVESRVEDLKQRRSTLDFVADQSRRLQRKLASEDKQRIDRYFSAVRDLENRLHSAEEWEYRPKPIVDAEAPEDIEDQREFVRKTKLTFDVMKLALETDSTRVVSLFVDTTVIHNITHHGNRPEAIAELRAKEEGQFDVLAEFLTSLASTEEQGETLLDRTMVLYGTCMGSANSHANNNLPMLLAGGGFRHGKHLAFDRENNYPVANIFVSMLQKMGIEADAFSTSTGTVTGLETA
ncbi:MAG TPA: DUF1552 domain-containing protein [Pirellulaceae bacterium]|nr:DUF1552 domain-containing protein [Pirellulaceae bacterium]